MAEKKFGMFAFLIWLSLAIISDLFSLIPYIGLIFSWPFAFFFFLFKWKRGINFGKIFLTTGFDILAEGIFSTLPANTADVIFTYFMSRV